MSQVRKLLNGSVIKAEEGGKYTINFDGQTVTLDEDQLTQINNDIAALKPELRMYVGGVSDSIIANEFSGDRATNRMSSRAFTNLSEKDLGKLNEASSWDTLSSNDRYRAREATNEVLNIIDRAVKNKKDSREKLGSDVVELDFNTDKDGNRYLSSINYAAKNRVNRILEHLQSDENSPYNADGWDFSNIRSWINDLKSDNKYEDKHDVARKYFEDVWSSMGQIGFDKKPDYNGQNLEDLLRMFRIKMGNGSSTENTLASGTSDTEKTLASDFADNPNLYNIIGDNFEKGSDGVWRLKPGRNFNLGFQLLPGQGIWFNDDFYKSQYGADNRLAALKGLTYYNGALYKLDDPTLKSILDAEGGYNELMRKGDWDGANDVIWTNFTKNNSHVPGRLDEGKYSEFLSNNPGYIFSNLTGAVQNLKNLDGTNYIAGNNDDIIQYIDLDNPNNIIGPYIDYNYKYAAVDRTGKKVADLMSPDEIPHATAKSFSNWYPRINNTGNKNYDGRYYIDLEDINGNETGYRFYVNPDDANDVYIHIPNLKASGVSESDDIALPKEVAKILMNTKDRWLPKVIGDATNQKRFGQFISKLVQSKATQAGLTFKPWDPTAYRELFTSDKGTLKRLGLNDAEIEALVGAMHNAYKNGTKSERMLTYRRVAPSINHNGGKIQYIAKLAKGGISTATNDVSDSGRKDRVGVKAQNYHNPAPISHMGQSDWTDADTTDLVALVADVASLGAAFIPGANTASATIGMGSSFARYGADISRDRNWWASTGNLLLNLGMDAAVLLPFAGGLAKSAKTVKAIKDALPTIIKAASVYGLGSAIVESANRIAKGEDWTTRDVSNLVNGLTAVTAIARNGGLGSNSKTSKSKIYSEDFKVGETNVHLGDTEIREIMKSSDQAKSLREAIRKQAHTATDTEVASAAEKMLKQKKNLWQRITRKDGDLALDVKKKKSTKTEEIGETDNAFVNWWHSTGRTQRLHNQQLRGESVGDTRAFKLSRIDTQVAATNPRKWRNKGTVTAEEIPLSQYKGRTFEGQLNPAFSEFTPQGPGTVYDGTANYTGTISKFIPTTISGIALPQIINPFGFNDNLTYSPLPQYKKGGKVIKAQNPSSKTFDPNWKPNSNFNVSNSVNWNLNFIPKNELLPNNSSTTLGTSSIGNTTLPNYKFDPTWKPSTTIGYNTPWWMDSTKTNNISKKIEKPDLSGAFNKNLPDRTKYIKPIVDLADAWRTARAQEKYADTDKQRIEAGRYHVGYAPVIGPDTNNPEYVIALNNLNQRRAGAQFGDKAFSDPMLQLAGWLQANQQYNAAENELTQNASRADTAMKEATREAVNATNAAAVNAENTNRQIDASINSAKYNPELERQLRDYASKTNQKLEFLNAVTGDREKLLQYNRSQYLINQDKQYQSDLTSQFSDAWKAYTRLDYSTKSQYLDFEDYLRKNVPNSDEWITARKEHDIADVQKYIIKNELNTPIGGLAAKRSKAGVDGMKKGGRINGKTRYTKDPDEQIWMDNNKGAYNQIAKLSDSTIRLLLKALK